MTDATKFPCPRCGAARTRRGPWPYKYDDCATCLRNEAERARWRPLTWEEFCAWLSGRRVVREGHGPGFDESQVFWERSDAQFESTYLDFDDGARARLTSNVSPSEPGYSEVTPGGPGHVEPPTVMVREAGEGGM